MQMAPSMDALCLKIGSCTSCAALQRAAARRRATGQCGCAPRLFITTGVAAHNTISSGFRDSFTGFHRFGRLQRTSGARAVRCVKQPLAARPPPCWCEHTCRRRFAVGSSSHRLQRSPPAGAPPAPPAPSRRRWALRSTSQSAAPPPPPPPLSCGKAKPCSASTALVSVIAAFSGACRALFESCQVTLAFGARTAGEQHLDCYCNMTARLDAVKALARSSSAT
jgi:hypothetical protein